MATECLMIRIERALENPGQSDRIRRDEIVARSVAAGQREAAPTFLGIRTSRTPVTSSHTSQAA